MGLWVNPICDAMFQQVYRWKALWPISKPAGTRKFLHKDGSTEDVVTVRAVTIAWHPKELEHLVRILKEVRPVWDMTVRLQTFFEQRAYKKFSLPGGRYRCEMATLQEEVDTLLRVLGDVRDGRLGENLTEVVQGGNFWE